MYTRTRKKPDDFELEAFSLIVRFDKNLAEIWGVKEKASISKLSCFFQVQVYKVSFLIGFFDEFHISFGYFLGNETYTVDNN